MDNPFPMIAFRIAAWRVDFLYDFLNCQNVSQPIEIIKQGYRFRKLMKLEKLNDNNNK